jgi:hypothetical protein
MRYPIAFHVAGFGHNFRDIELYLTSGQAEASMPRKNSSANGSGGFDFLGAAEIIAAGEIKLVNLFINPLDVPDDLEGVNFGGACSVTTWQTDFQGKSSIVGIPFECAEVRTTLKTP